MKEKLVLDNINGQEIKKLISSNKITVEQLDVPALEKLLDYETDLLLFGNGDEKLIKSCSDRLSLLYGDAIATENTTQGIIEENEAQRLSIETPVTVSKKKRIPLRTVIAAAILAAALGMLGVSANKTFFVAEYYDDARMEPIGFGIHLDKEDTGTYDYDIIHADAPRFYDSAEEMLKAEGLDIMYPDKTVKDKSHLFLASNAPDGALTLTFTELDSRIYFNASINSKATEESIAKENYVEVNGCKMYYDKRRIICSAFGVKDGIYYCVVAPTMEEVFAVLENIKEN